MVKELGAPLVLLLNDLWMLRTYPKTLGPLGRRVKTVAYVPPGSLAKGRALVNGAGGKGVACSICHGEGLKGLGDVPRLAGIHPIYIVRQLFNFQTGSWSSSAGAQMKKVVEKLTEDDMISIAAYAATLAP